MLVVLVIYLLARCTSHHDYAQIQRYCKVLDGRDSDALYYAMINMCYISKLVHPSDQFVDLFLTITEITTFNKVSSFL